MIDVDLVTAEDWSLWRELRLAALPVAPDAFGSTLADWSGEEDTEARWRGILDGVALNLVWRSTPVRHRKTPPSN